jgi:tetratricopeptide (TPR) repeat protein
MKPESLVVGVAGILVGLIAGWIIGSQQPSARRAEPAPAAASASTTQSASGAPARPALDESEVKRLEAIAGKDPSNVTPKAQLGNLYFDAERYEDAAKWYEKAMEVDPTNADVSTDLGVSYYYQNQPDKALAQFKRSLEIDPRHTKTMLNQGIVLAFGKQDLDGATRAWQRVIELAPGSPEGQAARRALDAMKAAHPGIQSPAPGAS